MWNLQLFQEVAPAFVVAGGPTILSVGPFAALRRYAADTKKDERMQGLDQVLGSSGVDLGGLGARFGLSPDQTQSALGSLMPAVLGGVHKRVEAGDADAVVNAGSSIAQPDTDSGNGVLGHIFGGKDVSRQVADHAAAQTGLSGGVMRAMLPVVAAMVAKHLAANGGQQGQAGGPGGGLGDLLGSLGGGGAMGGLGGLLGGGGGNPLDAILTGRR